MKAKDHAPELATGVEAEIKASWAAAPEMAPVFADQLYLVFANGMFHLTVGQSRLALGPNGEIEGEITPVVRLVVPEEAMRKMNTVLGNSLARQAAG